MDLADVAARDFEGILRALRVEHRVAEAGEEPVGEDAHGRFVLDEQDGLSALGARDRERGTGGIGLGLAIAERSVRLNQGQIRASNADGGGLMIEIELPQA